MNKQIIKRIVATVTVLMLGAFSLGYLHAEEVKVNESKLTNLKYVEKICPVTYTFTFKKDHLKLHLLGDGEGFYVVFDDFSAVGCSKEFKLTVCAITRDAELYGRVEGFLDGGMITLNLHDDRVRVKYPKGEKDRLSSEEIEELTAEYKEVVIDLNTSFKDLFEKLSEVGN